MLDSSWRCLKTHAMLRLDISRAQWPVLPRALTSYLALGPAIPMRYNRCVDHQLRSIGHENGGSTGVSPVPLWVSSSHCHVFYDDCPLWGYIRIILGSLQKPILHRCNYPYQLLFVDCWCLEQSSSHRLSSKSQYTHPVRSDMSEEYALETV